MSEEVLFRGKRIYDGKWVEGGILCTENWASIFVCKDYQGSLNEAPYSDVEEIDVIPETVGQFTGLLDKNGKKIFEGDILKCHDNPKDLVKVVFGEFDVVDTDTECPVDTVIGWHYEVIPTDELSTVEPFCLSMPLTKSYIEYCHMEVIGNIHDNPELLEMKGDA